MTRSVSTSKKTFVDKCKRRKSLIQEAKIDENKNASTSYHIMNMKQIKHWIETNLNVVEFMLWNFRKKNIELNDEYNKLFEKKTRLKTQYQRMKKQIEELEIEEESDEHEQLESLEMFVNAVRDTLIKIDVFVMTIIMTSKKLLDSSIFIDEKNSSIEDWLLIMRNKLKENVD